MGAGRAARHGRKGAGAGAIGRQAQALGRWGAGVRAARGLQAARARGPTGRVAGAREARAAGRAVGPAGCALDARSLFLSRFHSVFFRSQIFGHCS